MNRKLLHHAIQAIFIPLVVTVAILSLSARSEPTPNNSSRSTIDEVSREENQPQQLKSIVWEPNSLALSLSPGGEQSLSLTLLAINSLPTTELLFSADSESDSLLATFVKIEPVSIPNLLAGAKYDIHVSITAPSSVNFGTFHGKFFLRDRKGPLSPSINLTLGVWPVSQIENLPIQANIPPEWFVHSQSGSSYLSNVQEFSPQSDSSNLSESYMEFSIREGENQSVLPIDEWFNLNLAPQLNLPPTLIEITQIGSVQALRVTITESSTFTYLFVSCGPDIIEINYENYSENFQQIYQAIISSLRICT